MFAVYNLEFSFQPNSSGKEGNEIKNEIHTFIYEDSIIGLSKGCVRKQNTSRFKHIQ